MPDAMQLQISAVSCVRAQQSLFQPVSFTLHAGDVLLIEGANGSGKSSLLRMICGLATPSSGEVRWNGKLIADVRDDYVNEMHYVGHQNGLKLGLTGAENLDAVSCHYCHPERSEGSLDIKLILRYAQDDSNDIAHWHDINLDIPTKLLSAGQKRKLALSKLFLFPKKLWLLDEPLTALDANAQHIFFTKLEEHVQHGGMCIISSHQPLQFKHAAVNTLRLTSC